MAGRNSVIKRHPNGKIAVDQESVNGWDISYNPDDNRFYVCQRNQYGDLETAKTHGNENGRGLGNARQWARENPVFDVIV